jgi:hypothetical protein
VAVEQYVASRATADCRNGGDGNDPQQVESLAPGGYGAAHREHGNPK